MKSFPIVFALLAGLLLMSPAPARAQSDQTQANVDTSRFEIVYVSRTTKGRIEVGSPLFALVGTLPKLEVELTNSTGSERRLEYLVEWFGQDGSKAQTSVMWHSLYLLPNQRQTVRSVGQMEGAYRARLTLRETSRRPR